MVGGSAVGGLSHGTAGEVRKGGGVIALMLTIEILSFQPESHRAALNLRALAQVVRPQTAVQQTTRYQGRSDLLVLWGPGSPDRFGPMAAQVAKGGHVLALDLSYWGRDRKVRVSIDAAHPQAWVMRQDWPAARFDADVVPVRDAWKRNGPVIVAGIGSKARVQYGDAVGAWEQQMIAAVAERWPGRRILYRRKKADGSFPSGVELASNRPIDELLGGASLLVTWHSNVAVDAIRTGIPVICRDGAAAAVCPSAFGPDDPQPLAPDVRDRFLRNLSYFQWEPAREAAAFWSWVGQVLA
jgi:hypothetical protein